jgi:hypothetical protein
VIIQYAVMGYAEQCGFDSAPLFCLIESHINLEMLKGSRWIFSTYRRAKRAQHGSRVIPLSEGSVMERIATALDACACRAWGGRREVEPCGDDGREAIRPPLVVVGYSGG